MTDQPSRLALVFSNAERGLRDRTEWPSNAFNTYRFTVTYAVNSISSPTRTTRKERRAAAVRRSPSGGRNAVCARVVIRNAISHRVNNSRRNICRRRLHVPLLWRADRNPIVIVIVRVIGSKPCENYQLPLFVIDMISRTHGLENIKYTAPWHGRSRACGLDVVNDYKDNCF